MRNTAAVEISLAGRVVWSVTKHQVQFDRTAPGIRKDSRPQGTGRGKPLWDGETTSKTTEKGGTPQRCCAEALIKREESMPKKTLAAPSAVKENGTHSCEYDQKEIKGRQANKRHSEKNETAALPFPKGGKDAGSKKNLQYSN